MLFPICDKVKEGEGGALSECWIPHLLLPLTRDRLDKSPSLTLRVTEDSMRIDSSAPHTIQFKTRHNTLLATPVILIFFP